MIFFKFLRKLLCLGLEEARDNEVLVVKEIFDVDKANPIFVLLGKGF